MLSSLDPTVQNFTNVLGSWVDAADLYLREGDRERVPLRRDLDLDGLRRLVCDRVRFDLRPLRVKGIVV